ncbi:Uncharacterised protein [Cedecea davisae]|uniref:Uncharacterized protein n=1 Tax=Cedecea davisae DSM 4568 TaxID=566551 RepID=S3J5D9_9ENTR|nr:hypothetical protein [Cedecea davisae]EPF20440.1 hypothetical protein HMPREF0201_00166 [Cedecea davisae DSM 4568]SUX36760.1 Uncharacterised protein [Cedecea davisae]
MIKKLLEENSKNTNVEIIKDECVDGDEKMRRIVGKFIRDGMIYSFMNVSGGAWSYISIRFQFIYTAKIKKIIRSDILEIVNSSNKMIPSIKICLNDVKGKDIMINFSFEMPYLKGDVLDDVINPAIDMISFAPDLFSTRMTEKGILHKTIS